MLSFRWGFYFWGFHCIVFVLTACLVVFGGCGTVGGWVGFWVGWGSVSCVFLCVGFGCFLVLLSLVFICCFGRRCVLFLVLVILTCCVWYRLRI